MSSGGGAAQHGVSSNAIIQCSSIWFMMMSCCCILSMELEIGELMLAGSHPVYFIDEMLEPIFVC